MHAESLGELSAFVQELKGVDPLEAVVYKPFKNYVLNLLADNVKGVEIQAREQLIEFFEGAGEFLSHKDLSEKTNFFFSLGGDGTFLSALPFLRDSNIPIVPLPEQGAGIGQGADRKVCGERANAAGDPGSVQP